MACYTNNWRMRNAGLGEDSVLLGRERRWESPSLGRDTIYYGRNGELRRNTLSYDSEHRIVAREDRRIFFHPFLEEILNSTKIHLLTLPAFSLLYFVVPEARELSVEDTHSWVCLYLSSVILTTTFWLTTISPTAIDAWRLYKDMEREKL